MLTKDELLAWKFLLHYRCYTKKQNINFNIFDFDLILAKINRNKQDRPCTYKHNIEACWYNHCCCGEAVTIAYSECVFVALLINHVMHMCSFILSCVAFLALPYFCMKLMVTFCNFGNMPKKTEMLYNWNLNPHFKL